MSPTNDPPPEPLDERAEHDTHLMPDEDLDQELCRFVLRMVKIHGGWEEFKEHVLKIEERA